MRPDPRPQPRETKLLPNPPLTVAADGAFAGYASLFGVPDLGRDVVAPGAFAESLARRGTAGIRMLCPHPSGRKKLKQQSFIQYREASPQRLPQRSTRTPANAVGRCR